MDEKGELKTGTTTVGVVGKNAVVLAADMKATMGHLSYDLEARKIYKITDHIALTNAGMVGDSLMLIRYLKAQAKLYEIERESGMSSRAMSTFLSNVLNANRYYPYSVQFIIGGRYKEPILFELTPYGGIIERTTFATSGSGTTLAMSTLDQNFKENMTTDEAVRLAIRAVASAKKRDIYSGGRSVSVVVIDDSGVKELDDTKVKKHLAEIAN